MALWASLQQLQGEIWRQAQTQYGEHTIPIELRHYLASWIEERSWSDLDPNNPNHEQSAAMILNEFTNEIEQKANLLPQADFINKMKLQESMLWLKQKYATNPMRFVQVINHCINTERKMLSDAEQMGFSSTLADMTLNSDSRLLIGQELDQLRQRTQETGCKVRELDQLQEHFAIQYHEFCKLNGAIQAFNSQRTGTQTTPQQSEMEKKLQKQKETAESGLTQGATHLANEKLALTNAHREAIQLLAQVQKKVLDDELLRWKRSQQLNGNGAPFNNNLDQIQEWCECLAELIWTNRQQIKEVERMNKKLNPNESTDVLQQLNSDVTQLLSSLVTSTFIIEKQPPQVMKTNTRFTASVRLLVGGKLSVHMTPPLVKVTIISETQSNALLKHEKTAKNDASGEILNNTGTMEYIPATRQLSVNFRNMQLRKIKRAEKKGTESVMDEKFSLLFQSQFSVGGGELGFHVWTLSLPVVVIVHGNQEPHAWATISWDNAFAEQGRIPFVVPDKVVWYNVAEMLNLKFKSLCGRGLNDDQMRYLAGKAMRKTVSDYRSQTLTWSQFCKEPLPDRSFTFWEWFYAILKLTRDHLRSPWNDNLVIGFISRQKSEELLLRSLPGTFLLRFSDSELGGIAIACCKQDLQTGVLSPQHLQPSTHKDFNIRPLPDRLSDLKDLIYLYPNIPKDQAFGKYYTPYTESQNATDTGYVKSLLVTCVPKWSGAGASGMDSQPNTPQAFYPHSPDQMYHRDPPSVASVTSDSLQGQALTQL